MGGELILLAVPIALLVVCCCCLLRPRRERREGFSVQTESTKFTGYPTVDLHGRSVSQAIKILETKLYYGRPFTVITGQGLHSSGGVGHIRQAVIRYLSDHNYSYEIDGWNSGRIHVH